MTDESATRTAVQTLYNTYPFPPEPLLDEPPPGYNWRWNWIAAYNFCTRQKPSRENIRILDAGCGTGVGTEYLILLNPQAEIVGIDLSEKALEIAQERSRRSGVSAKHEASVSFHHLKLEEASQLPGEFDLINCVGVLHHLPDPVKGIQALASKLAPGGIMHIFVYSEIGRWEIQLMQRAIALLQGNKRGNYQDGVFVGRQIFSSLPENNRIVKREKERWSLENHRDESFADMYVHPQEIDYNVETLFELIEASGLEFIGFSNPKYWELERLIGKSPELIERAKNLSEREKYRLVELLDPEITHYEFFLGKPPIDKIDWSKDETLLSAIGEVHPCMYGWPSSSFLDYEYQPVTLTETEFQFLQTCDGKLTVGEILQGVKLELDEVRSLQDRQLLILTPTH
ncbi:Methyltransferase type 12 [Gloeothece citriformis PCC 7424]|uniref:Methyltransferase type 12 n=1 Tax=Gloeothece citriformis (strain PCC 7424) TaxID=65393 RepID=B7KKS6_GLOC7|nr:class I SAM-dependent methyltransferase [Gloeothece citriformis]ACK71045.1 Methyltransferase type 12 [Gloeothece citriformis PCC 7424]